MLNIWFFIALLFAVTQWYARWRHVQWLHYITKPATLLALCIWFWQAGGWQGKMAWFALGLGLSLLGDVLLMLPQGFFLAGLAAFMATHLCYICGFFSTTWLTEPFIWGLALLTAIGAGWLMQFFLKALRRRSYSRRMQIPVALYTIVIAAMLFSAAATLLQPAWQTTSALLVTAGALLFVISDGLLASDRFVSRVRLAHVWVMMTYHLGQIGILLGVVTQFST